MFYRKMHNYITYVKSFHLKEPSGEGANHLRSPPLLPLSTLLSLVKIGGKLKEEFLDNETQSLSLSLRYGSDHKSGKDSYGTLNQILAQPCYSH